MNIQLGMGLTLTWSTIGDLILLLVVLRAYWPWLEFVLRYAIGPILRFVLSAILLAAMAVLLYALFLAPVSFEISLALQWWLLVWFSYALLAAVAFDFASAHSLDSTDGRFEIIGFLVGGLIGIGAGIGLALLLFGWTAGAQVGLVLALIQIVIEAAGEYRYRSAMDPTRRRADTEARQVDPFWRLFADLLRLYLIYSYILNVLVVTFFTYARVVTAAGFAAIFSNLYRIPGVLRLAALNMLKQIGLILIAWAVWYLWSRRTSSSQGGNGPPGMDGPQIPRGDRRPAHRRLVPQQHSGDPHPM